MTTKILSIGDPHLSEQSGLSEDFQDIIWKEVRDRDIDHIAVPGDVIDNVPKKRKETDIELGRQFYQQLNEIGRPVIAVPGNHDYDIHDELTSNIENVYSLQDDTVDLGENTFVGLGATQFNLYPEIELDTLGKYDNVRSNNYESNKQRQDLLEYLSKANLENYSELESYFQVEEDDKKRFRSSLEKYRNRLDSIEESMNSYDENLVLLDHSPPFGTDTDINLNNEHMGSLVSRSFIEKYSPGLAISGHLHDGGMDTLESGKEYTAVINAGKRQLTEIKMTDNSLDSFENLNEPEID